MGIRHSSVYCLRPSGDRVEHLVCKVTLSHSINKYGVYAIVMFTVSDQVEIVSGTWFDGNQCCLWPNYWSSLRITKAVTVRVHKVPDDNWKAHKIRMICLIGMFNFTLF